MALASEKDTSPEDEDEQDEREPVWDVAGEVEDELVEVSRDVAGTEGVDTDKARIPCAMSVSVSTSIGACFPEPSSPRSPPLSLFFFSLCLILP